MNQDWLIVVNLGSFAMLGVGLVLLVLWGIDRRRTSALCVAGAVAFYFGGTTALSLPLGTALASSIHGVLYPIAVILLADGLLRRSGQRLPTAVAIGFVGILAAAVWFFAYVSPHLAARVATQSLGSGVLFLAVLVWAWPARSRADRVVLVATAVMTSACFVNVVAAALSRVPREITNDAELESYLGSNLEVVVLIASAVVLPAVTITLLAVTMFDVVSDLRSERDRDELTGLWNRRGFIERAGTSLRQSPRSALILADLDFFKEVNDAFGHPGGDLALQKFAAALRLRSVPGQILGRLGGEEFAVLFRDVDASAAIAWTDSVRAQLADCPVSTVRNGPLTASFGISVADSMSLVELIEAADRALYQAKANGRNCTAVHA